MKMKYSVLVAISLLVVSCQSVSIEDVDKSQEITIDAVFGDDNATKTVRNDSDGKIYWKPGDQINVFFGSETGVFTSSNTENVAKASFTGSITISSVIGLNEGEEDANSLWGLYPYNSSATFDGTHVNTTLSNAQTGIAGTFADDLYITLAKSNSFLMSFNNVLSGIKFSLVKEGITSIEFKGNNGEPLTGNLQLSYDSDTGKPTSSITGNAQTVIILTPEGEAFETGKNYYIVFNPVTLSSGFTMTFYTATQKASFVYSSSMTFSRNVFKSRANIDSGIEFEDVIPETNIIRYTASEQIFPTDTRGFGATYNEALSSYNQNTGEGYVVFDAAVTSIGQNAFKGNEKIQSIRIPSSVDYISDYAFFGCHALKEVILPSNIRKIGKCAFMYCYGLESICLPSTITTLDAQSFSRSSIKSIVLPSSITILGEQTFSGCEALEIVEFGSGITKIPSSAFFRCTKLANVSLSESIKTIADNAFCECYQLTYIDLRRVETIEGRAFAYTGLTSLYIPRTTTSISSEAFNGCSSLTTLEVSSDNPTFYSVYSKDACGYDFNAIIKKGFNELDQIITGTSLTMHRLSLYSSTIGKNFKIADYAFAGMGLSGDLYFGPQLPQIGSSAFANNPDITSIHFRRKAYDNSFYYTLGDYVFVRCTGIKEVHFETPNPPTVGGSIFLSCGWSFTIYVPLYYLSTYKSTIPLSNYQSIMVGE